MRCRDAGGPALAAQVLIYPVTDVSSFETGSHREFGDGYFLTRAAMDWFTGHYLASSDQKRNPEASPLLAPNLNGLPPALVITAEFDPLRDEGEAYAERLRQAGVPVTVTRYPGMIHGFVSMHGVLTGGRQAVKEAAEFTRSGAKQGASAIKVHQPNKVPRYDKQIRQRHTARSSVLSHRACARYRNPHHVLQRFPGRDGKAPAQG